MKRFLLVLALLFAATLTRSTSIAESPFCAGALHAQAQGQDPVMPPEGGNPDHSEPAKGAYCDHSDRAAHACKCHNRCEEDADGKVTFVEDGVHCRAYCWKGHCHCPADNCQAPTPSKLKATLSTIGNTAAGAAVIVGSSYAWYLLTHGHK